MGIDSGREKAIEWCATAYGLQHEPVQCDMETS